MIHWLSRRPLGLLLLTGIVLQFSAVQTSLRQTAAAQSGALQTAPAVGIRTNTPTVHAFIHARIVAAPGRTLEDATLVIRDGVIASIGKGEPPHDARVWDLRTMTIYPGFINGYSEYGMPAEQRQGDRRRSAGAQRAPAPETERGARYWNSGVLAHQSAAELFSPDPKAAERLRAQGCTSALVVPPRGILKGTSAVVSLADGKAADLVLRSPVAHHISLEVNQASERYPNSLMGLIALVRQSLSDADWYQKAQAAYARLVGKGDVVPRPERDETLAALRGAITGVTPVVIETSDEQDALRAERIAAEFKLNLILRGSGKEYRRLDAMAGLHRTIILPVDLPDVPRVQTPEEALEVTLAQLRHWDEAPENPGRLQGAGVRFVLTSWTPADTAAFLPRLRKIVQRGLSRDAALAALTTEPAKLFGVENTLGTLEPGKAASFLVASGDLFADRTMIRETWVDGKRYPVRPAPELDPRGSWSVSLRTDGAPADSLQLTLKGEPEGLAGSVRKMREGKLSTAMLSGLRLELSFAGDTLGYQGIVRMTGALAGSSTSGPSGAPAAMIEGTGEWADGRPFSWSARRTGPFVPDPDTARLRPPAMASFPPVYPYGEFGRAHIPDQPAAVLVRNATIWTSGPQGVIEGGDLLVEKGKISRVGKGLSAPSGAMVIDGSGKHVTSGIIDCHSHMAATGSVNETGFAISAEVRVGDVIDCDEIDLYRNLAGGLTVSHVLHGSANPIGGQNQLIKVRWGMLPEQMKFEGAPPTIKFALGENVKQSNWQSATPRYPQTRMGVEQIMRDEFRAALDYEKAWQRYKDEGTGVPPRRNLQLDAVLEVLHGRMFVHCHAYRQDEILATMKVAEDFGFRIRAFQHILEGYKVADLMAKHGAGGSTFSDWWAYKFEVYDAIPYNAALMQRQGVLVSLNSDSDELSRRLNLEAAKAVKYGGLSETEALNLVTINPAKQLFIDKRVGSLEPGKDADFAIWSGHPLSTLTICEQTWIDGRRYFDRQEDRQLYEESQRERAVLIQKALAEKRSAPGGARAGGRQRGGEEVQP